MARIDFYVGNLARLSAAAVVLESDAPVLFKFPAGDRRANQTLTMKELTALVEEIAPPDQQGVLMAGREARFDHAFEGASYRITVTPGVGQWRVTIAPRAAGPGPVAASTSAAASTAASTPAPSAVAPSALAPPATAPRSPVAADPGDDVHNAQLLGRLAVHYKLVTMDQLEEALRDHGRRGNRPLGAILVERGLLTEPELAQLLEAQARYQEQQRGRPRSPTRPAPPMARPDAVPGIAATPMAAAPNAAPAIAVAAPTTTTTTTTTTTPATAPAAARPARAAKRPTVAPDRPTLQPLAKPSGARVRTDALDQLLQRAAAAGASDVLVHPDRIKLRVFGQLVDAPDKISAAQSDALIHAIVDDARAHVLDDDGEVDFTYAIPEVGRFRTSVYRQHRGTCAVFHIIPPTPPTLDMLGLPAELAKVTNYPQGLVLVTGPAGCGKTSTLAALVNLINEERHDHILTIEDPIEYQHPSRRCLVNQREVRRHTETFARALRAALREDPDVICIGELRDLETISLAMSAAETGHLVLATLHTNSAIRTINRIVGAYPSDQQGQIRTMLSESLRAVISQRLLPNAAGDGLALALEVLQVNPAVANLIRDNRAFQLHSVMQTGRARGHKLLDHSLVELVNAGTITAETAAANSDNPNQFRGPAAVIATGAAAPTPPAPGKVK